jgi:hypothetical protein
MLRRSSCTCAHGKVRVPCHAILYSIKLTECGVGAYDRRAMRRCAVQSGWEPHAHHGSQTRRCDRFDENRKGPTGPTRSKGVRWPRAHGVFSATGAPTRAQPAEVRKDRAPLLPIRAPESSEARNGLSAGKAKSACRTRGELPAARANTSRTALGLEDGQPFDANSHPIKHGH